jgi:hypothetical protein
MRNLPPCCPHCGKTLRPSRYHDIDGLTLVHREYQLYAAVKNAGKRGISTDQLINVIYGDDISGRPLTAASKVRTLVADINKRSASLGRIIYNTNPRGGYGATGMYKILVNKK